MYTSKRLDQIFASAKEISFSNYSRIILMSDCHRGDGSKADDFAPNKKIYQESLLFYYRRGFTYIELGDADELWEAHTYTNILQSYPDIFQILQRFYLHNRYLAVWGNHDIVKKELAFRKNNLYFSKDDDQPLFPGIEAFEGLILKYSGTPFKIFLIHGHQGDPINDRYWRVSRFLTKNIWRPLEFLGVNDPISPAVNHRKKNTIEKRLIEWVTTNNQMMIAGHTHRPVFPSPGEAPYFNDGSCVHPDGITGMELVGGTIALVKWERRLNKSGDINIVRNVLAGPRPLWSIFIDKSA